jgi:hypothetical protein
MKKVIKVDGGSYQGSLGADVITCDKLKNVLTCAGIFTIHTMLKEIHYVQ